MRKHVSFVLRSGILCALLSLCPSCGNKGPGFNVVCHGDNCTVYVRDGQGGQFETSQFPGARKNSTGHASLTQGSNTIHVKYANGVVVEVTLNGTVLQRDRADEMNP